MHYVTGNHHIKIKEITLGKYNGQDIDTLSIITVFSNANDTA
jgi:hypothetical protein